MLFEELSSPILPTRSLNPVRPHATSYVHRLPPAKMIFLCLLLLVVELARDGFAARADDAGGESFSRDQLDFFEARVRPANPADLEIGLAFLHAARPDQERRSAWVQYTQVLLGSNEFMYLR